MMRICLLFIMFYMLFPFNHASININVVITGFDPPPSITSLPIASPSLEMAMRSIQQTFNSTFNFTLSYIGDKKIYKPETNLDETDYTLAEWYYRQRDKSSIPIFIVPVDLKANWYSFTATLFSQSALEFEDGLNQTYIKSFSSQVERVDFKSILKEFNSISRVLLFFGDAGLLRQLLITAAGLGMTDGEHVYVANHPFVSSLFGKMSWQRDDENDQVAKLAFRSLLVIEPLDATTPMTEFHNKLEKEIQRRSLSDFNVSYSIANQPFHVNMAGYVALQTLAMLLNETFHTNRSLNYSDGERLAKLFFNRSFDTDIGRIYYDKRGERLIDMAISRFSENMSSKTIPFMWRPADSVYFRKIISVNWVGPHWPPPNEPVCGYKSEKAPCKEANELSTLVYAASFASILSLTVAIGIAWYFSYQKRYLVWKVPRERIVDPTNWNTGLLLTASSARKNRHLGVFDGIVIWKTAIPSSKSINPCIPTFGVNSKSFLRLIHMLNKTRHHNINTFVGICIDSFPMLIISTYCKRGCLYDFIQEEHVIDWDLKFSFLVDLFQGIQAIHRSLIGCHGFLNSSTCLLDHYFGLKISAVGYNLICRYLSPEICEESSNLALDDICAFGVTACEIVSQRLPADARNLETAEGLSPKLNQLIQSCLFGFASTQLSLRTIKAQLKEILMDGAVPWETSLFDKLLLRLQKQSERLEKSVSARTRALVQERHRCEMLLREMLPPKVIKELRQGRLVPPRSFKSVTVFFGTVYGVGEYATEFTLWQVATFLHDLSLHLDRAIANYKVYKVDSTGGDYMIAAGEPVPDLKFLHVAEICRMAIELQSIFERNYPASVMKLSVGINTGPVASAVIGIRHPKYCLFGETVNLASLVNSHGQPSRIHVTQETATLGETFGLMFEARKGGMAIMVLLQAWVVYSCYRIL